MMFTNHLIDMMELSDLELNRLAQILEDAEHEHPAINDKAFLCELTAREAKLIWGLNIENEKLKALISLLGSNILTPHTVRPFTPEETIKCAIGIIKTQRDLLNEKQDHGTGEKKPMVN